MGWEVKIDMSGQFNDCLWVCNAKMKKIFTGAEMGHISKGFWVSGGHSIKQFESFLTGLQLPIGLTVVDTF